MSPSAPLDKEMSCNRNLGITGTSETASWNDRGKQTRGDKHSVAETPGLCQKPRGGQLSGYSIAGGPEAVTENSRAGRGITPLCSSRAMADPWVRLCTEGGALSRGQAAPHPGSQHGMH